MNVTKLTEKKQVVTYKETTVGVTVELTIKEAEDLNRIFYHIGGTPEGSPRETTEKLAKEFELLGVGRSDVAPERPMYFRTTSSY